MNMVLQKKLKRRKEKNPTPTKLSTIGIHTRKHRQPNWEHEKVMALMNVATPLWPSVGVKPNTWKSLGFGVLRDS
jgi:hypothetical protein